MADYNSQLIIQMKEARPQIVAFYEKLDKDANAQKEFLANPEGYLKAAGVPSQLSTNNRLLFSLMSNKKFTEWTEQYERSLQKKYPSGTDWESVDYATIISDVYNAIVENGGKELVNEAFGKEHEAKMISAGQPTPQPLYTWHWTWLYVAAVVLPIVLLAHKPIEHAFIGASNLAHIIDTISSQLQKEGGQNRPITG
jgi:hypothetical protein